MAQNYPGSVSAKGRESEVHGALRRSWVLPQHGYPAVHVAVENMG